MSKIAILTNPSHDRETEYMESWSEKLVLDKNSPQNIIELKKEEVKKSNFEKILTEKDPKLLILNGHGNKTDICGYDREIIIKVGDNENILNKKIVHALACAAGHTLGPKSVKAGAIAFIGYKENFKAVCLNHATKHGQKSDPVAELSFVPAFLAANLLLEGKTVGEAYDASHAEYIKNFRKAIAHPDETYKQFVANRLLHNINYHVCIGDRSAKLL